MYRASRNKASGGDGADDLGGSRELVLNSIRDQVVNQTDKTFGDKWGNLNMD